MEFMLVLLLSTRLHFSQNKSKIKTVHPGKKKVQGRSVVVSPWWAAKLHHNYSLTPHHQINSGRKYDEKELKSQDKVREMAHKFTVMGETDSSQED